jgi:DNA primase
MAFGRIPQSFIDDVLLRTDIVDLIDGRVKLKKAGKNYAACCPFHNEKSPSFTVSRDKQFYYCFGCGASGNAISFLMDYERLEFVDSLKQLAGQVGLELPDTREEGSAAPRESQQPLYDTLEAAAKFYEDQLRHAPARERAVSYFKSRGLSGKIAKTYRLGYAPPGWDNLNNAMGGELAVREKLLATGLLVRNENSQKIYDGMRDRVIFPIRDVKGRVIAFGGRVLNDDKPKYLNSPESPVFHKGQELYGLYEARQHTKKLERVVVVEGYMDVVALAQFGISYAVATLGTATSTTHIERLFRMVPEIIFCFDGDNAGRKAAWRALESTLPALQDGKLVSFLFLPQDEDPDSLVRKEGPELFEARLKSQTEGLADFMFRTLGAELRLDTMEGRTRLATEAKPLLATVPDGLYREMLLDELARQSGLDKDRLRSALLETKPLPVTVIRDPAPSEAPNKNAPKIQPKQRTTKSREKTASLTVADQALMMLLQTPEEALQIDIDKLRTALAGNDEFLLEVVELIHETPGIGVPGLIGIWQGTPKGELIGKLAAYEFLIQDDIAKSQFKALVRKLEVHAISKEIEDIVAKLATKDATLEMLIEQSILVIKRDIFILEDELCREPDDIRSDKLKALYEKLESKKATLRSRQSG